MQSHLTGKLLGATAMLALATGLGGCSIMPGWADPTSWFSSDEAPAEKTPDLANIPGKPDAETAAPEKLADSLTADMKHAQYSADTLRGGTDRAAPPPPDLPASTAATAAIAGTLSTAAGAGGDDETMGDVTAPDGTSGIEDDTPKEDRSVSKLPEGKSVPGALPDVSHAQTQKSVQTASAAPVAKQNVAVPRHVASAAPAPRAAAKSASAEAAAPSDDPDPAPAAKLRTVADTSTNAPVAAKPAVQPAAPAPVVDDLGFQVSSAPPLDPSLSNFVPSSIVDRYHRAAAQASSVVSETDTASASAPATGLTAMEKAVVLFPDDIVTLNPEARKLVRRFASQYRSSGQRGYIRVVGHASSRTPDMPLKQHFDLIYKKSQDRADAVSKALVREGVPADKILVEAVGDSQPVYYESMPQGEEGNRRVEIFLQG